MIDHLGMPVSDLARATEFYLEALAPLGYGIVMQVSAEQTGHGAAVGFGPPGRAADFQSGKPSFWIGEGEPLAGHIHVAFVAPSRAASMRSIAPRWPPAARITASRACARITTPIITAPSCSTSTATISRRSATPRRSSSEAVAHQKSAQVRSGSATSAQGRKR